MAKHQTSRWRRLRRSIAIDPGFLAAGSAVIDTFGLLALKREQLAVRRRSEALGAPGTAEPASAQPGDAPRIGCARHQVRN
jgi:hypothetical protein